MVTLKQIEALHWIVTLGTFERAAVKLHATQSTVSKRIQELEASSGITVFEREHRAARLTEKGEHLLALGREMLALQERILELKHSKDLPPRHLRLGVTETTALTWLPQFVTALRETFPGLVIEPEVDVSRDLFERLRDEALDVIIVPDVFTDPGVSSAWVADAAFVWAASPDLVRSKRVMSMDELAEHTILMQGSRSGSGVYLSRWFLSQGVVFPRALSSDNLVALAGLAVAGLGITYLPRHCFDRLVGDGKLGIIETQPALPAVPYAAMYRNDRPSPFVAKVADLARRCCDFSHQFAG